MMVKADIHTMRPRRQRLPAALWRVALVGLLISHTHRASAEDTVPAVESPDRIAATASAFIAKRNPWKAMNHRIEVDRLDPRTRLPKCESALTAYLPPGATVRRRTTVGVRCEGPKPWKIFVPVSIAAYTKVMVANRPIGPGTTISRDTVSWVERDVATLSYGYLPSLEGQGGLRARRSIAQGAVITANMVEANAIVHKGQRISLRSDSGPISVTMSGIALEDGAVNGRIAVRNLSSGRRLEGIVESSEVVVLR